MSRHSRSSARIAALSTPDCRLPSIGLLPNCVPDGGCLRRRCAPDACFPNRLRTLAFKHRAAAAPVMPQTLAPDDLEAPALTT
jgi:hypothetical protein